ncbi:uncharacterized protein ASCRUDRAFT_78229 [Ascoidea rubescens DSM 1968]|uniref:Uncharacterized protein n=1 Tax=Ascoidea rubescens DSM 1968 TaxID=1344418 RepID=A0A1D2V9H4_9ASCO|nr:hypothetical protein ASCRUDRAFT_78323 [Ascoidea rubescens DSM 1968]XP_020044434.1 hypothetical protein ASCRUDRAFT_78229 [Ascoidea rubescens DSM 1968]ODV57864.1 hypothetical protein ASCRUDRAFT_78323 [Ascoidea rubescens DSM 1968]ODV58127.1 hypothetical protein ASCRUDRAFT_78229 [Ascoidea rubescens DSM 1968]
MSSLAAPVNPSANGLKRFHLKPSRAQVNRCISGADVDSAFNSDSDSDCDSGSYLPKTFYLDTLSPLGLTAAGYETYSRFDMSCINKLSTAVNKPSVAAEKPSISIPTSIPISNCSSSSSSSIYSKSLSTYSDDAASDLSSQDSVTTDGTDVESELQDEKQKSQFTLRQQILQKEMDINNLVIAAHERHSKKQQVLKQFDPSIEIDESEYKYADTFNYAVSKRAAFKRCVRKLRNSIVSKTHRRGNNSGNDNGVVAADAYCNQFKSKQPHTSKRNYNKDAFRQAMAELVYLEYQDQLESLKGYY